MLAKCASFFVSYSLQEQVNHISQRKARRIAFRVMPKPSTVGRDSVEPKLDFQGKCHGSTESRPTFSLRHGRFGAQNTKIFMSLVGRRCRAAQEFRAELPLTGPEFDLENAHYIILSPAKGVGRWS
jgi:hypothetical protein